MLVKNPVKKILASTSIQLDWEKWFKNFFSDGKSDNAHVST